MRNGKPNRKPNNKVQREQPRKDSSAKRINCDNERESKFDRKVERMADNDVRWYAANDQLLASAASVNFSDVLGNKLPNAAIDGVPGILTINWIPSIGDSTIATTAANNNYSYTVHANSRNTRYNAPDEFMYIYAADSVFYMLALGIRAYGAMKAFDQRNTYTPKALINAMGFDYEDLKSNLANMWFDLNQLIAEISVIWVPNTMPVIERHYWMSTNIYMDANSSKAQFYMYVPYGYYEYNPTLTETGGGLSFQNWMTLGLNTWSSYITKMHTLIQPLITDEDLGIMAGDILKAYGADKIYRINEITSDYTLLPVYNREVLTQFNNATAANFEFPTIEQTATGLIVQNPGPMTSATYGINKLLPQMVQLNFFDIAAPTPADVMVATRMTSAAPNIVVNNTTASVTELITGTEIAHHFQLYYYSHPSTGTELRSMTFGSCYFVGNGYSYGSYEIAEKLGAFDWAPYMYRVGTPPSPITNGFIPANGGIFGDVDNYTFVDRNTLKKMHLAAIYSEFGVPYITR